MTKSTITPRAYAQAFLDWARVNAHFDDDERADARAIAERVLGQLNPDATVEITLLCKAAQATPRKHLASVAVSKSALLWRLIYEQEPLRTVECPVHKGRMNTGMYCGLVRPPCVFGCDGTGWLHELPARLTLRLDNVTYSWPREAGRGADLVMEYLAAHRELRGVSDPTAVLAGVLRNAVTDHLEALALIEPTFCEGGPSPFVPADQPAPPRGLTHAQFRALVGVITNPTETARKALKERL